MPLTLYYMPFACSMVPYLTLVEAGAEFDVSPVNFMKGEHMSPEFLRLNPKHAVPVLVVNGEALTENVAIQIWIARNFPQAKLLPADPIQEIKAIAFMAWCASSLHPSLTPLVMPQKFCDLPGSEESVKRCAEKLLLEKFQLADDLLEGREWFFDHFTAPDAYFFWVFRRATQIGLNLSRFTNCLAHLERMQTRPSVQKLVAYEAEVLAGFKKTA